MNFRSAGSKLGRAHEVRLVRIARVPQQLQLDLPGSADTLQAGVDLTRQAIQVSRDEY